CSNSQNQNFIVKSVHAHWRLQNEADILKRFESKTSFLRPTIDEIVIPSDPQSIVLRYLDDDIMTETYKKKLSRCELKFVARRVLEALKVLHDEGFIHTVVKLDNMLVNHGNRQRFSEVQLADLGGTVSVDSKWAVEGHIVRTAYWRSPKVLLGMRWGTSADVWSFGCSILMLIYGNYYPFNPLNYGVTLDDDEYDFGVLQKHHQYLGSFPISFAEIADEGTQNAIVLAMKSVPREKMKPFSRITQKEIAKVDNDFLQKILRFNPRERLTAGGGLERLVNMTDDGWNDREFKRIDRNLGDICIHSN
ncbi:putative mitogen-activated protein kinase sty1 protein, partial [Botrytis fragariae]